MIDSGKGDGWKGGGAAVVTRAEEKAKSVAGCVAFAVHAGWGVQFYDDKAFAGAVGNASTLMDNPDWTTYILRKSGSGGGNSSTGTGTSAGSSEPCTPPASIAACPGHADKATCEGDETCKWSSTAVDLVEATAPRPSCKPHKGSVYVFCGSDELKKWGVGPEGEKRAIGNCNSGANSGRFKCPVKGPSWEMVRSMHLATHTPRSHTISQAYLSQSVAVYPAPPCFPLAPVTCFAPTAPNNAHTPPPPFSPPVHH